MAFAIVKSTVNQDKQINATLEVSKLYSDSGEISYDREKYVSIAYKLGVMQGSDDGKGGKKFQSQYGLTRAEAAVILYRAFFQ